MSKKLFVANLPYSVTSEGLRDLFGLYGQIRYTRVVMDKKTGKSKGFGFIEFEIEQDAKNAVLDMNKKKVKDRELKVQETD